MLVIHWYISVFVKHEGILRKIKYSLASGLHTSLKFCFQLQSHFLYGKTNNLAVRKHYKPHCTDIKYEVKRYDGGSQDG